MFIIEEVFFILLYTTLVYLWNKYIVPLVIGTVVEINNHQWLNRNKSIIIKVYQYFFWGGLMLFILSRIYFLIKGDTY